MKDKKSKKMIIAYGLYIIIVGFFNILLFGGGFKAILGLVLGFLIALSNYKLLGLTIQKFLGVSNILTIQLLFLRYLLYLLTAFLCMKLGNHAVIMYAAGILGLSIAVFITYGIGGMNEK